MTDPIADMLTRVRNAYGAKHQKVDVPLSKVKVEIARILKEEGFINNYKIIGEGARRNIRVYLRYGPKGEQVVSKLERVSRPIVERVAKKLAASCFAGSISCEPVRTRSSTDGRTQASKPEQAETGGPRRDARTSWELGLCRE